VRVTSNAAHPPPLKSNSSSLLEQTAVEQKKAASSSQPHAWIQEGLILVSDPGSRSNGRCNSNHKICATIKLKPICNVRNLITVALPFGPPNHPVLA